MAVYKIKMMSNVFLSKQNIIEISVKLLNLKTKRFIDD